MLAPDLLRSYVKENFLWLHLVASKEEGGQHLVTYDALISYKVNYNIFYPPRFPKPT